MRQALVITTPDLAGPVGEFMGSIPGVTFRVTSSADEIPWSDIDCLWQHDVCRSSPELTQWLAAGGRLLATLDAARLPVEVGIETVAPDEIRDSVWESTAGERGLAAFGAHPLFEGVALGACTWRPVGGEGYRWVAYLSGRPAAGQVVAVERTGLELNADRVVAWEYRVGQGGVLCIGTDVHPDAADQRCAAQLRTLIGNALAGSGIPHHSRLPGVRHWPAPGHQVVRNDLASVPPLPRLDEALAEANGPGSSALRLEVAGEWNATGRRALVTGTTVGLQELWIHPFRAAGAASVRVRGSESTTESVRVSPELVERRSIAGEAVVLERWLVALEHPVVYWDLEAPAGAPLQIEWTTDLRRAWPFPPASAGDLELSISPDGRHAVLGAVGDPFRLIVDVQGATLEALPREGPAVVFSARGTGACRIRFAGASDQADLDRSRQMLDRRGWAGVGRQRADHARELATYATSVDSPEPAVVEGCEWAKFRMDALLAGTPTVGRSLLGPISGRSAASATPGFRYVGAEACLLAAAQLAMGDRGAPRDTLKFLSLSQDVDGRIIDECSTGGLARYGTDPAIPHYLLLAAGYAAWTGELDFLSRRWAAIRRAVEAGMRAGAATPTWRAAFAGIQPLAEALGHLEMAEVLGEWATRGGPDASGVDLMHPEPEASAAFREGRFEAGLDRLLALGEAVRSGDETPSRSAAVARLAVEGLWGVQAAALAGAVRLAPWFPPAWDAMALERLRVGRSVLTVRMRRRFGQVAAQVERVHGPRIHVEFVLRGGPAPGSTLLDDVALGGDRVAFEADGAHALVWNS